MLEVHVGKNMYKGGRVLYNVRSTHPSTTHTQKKEQQQKKKKQKKHTHTNTSYGMVQNGRWWVDYAPRHENGDITGHILSRHKFVVTRELVASYCHGNILD